MGKVNRFLVQIFSRHSVDLVNYFAMCCFNGVSVEEFEIVIPSVKLELKPLIAVRRHEISNSKKSVINSPLSSH